MNTCVLCLSRRNAFEWTIRSRSRWNGVRWSESGSSRTRRAGYDGVASGEWRASSARSIRSRKDARASLVIGGRRFSQAGSAQSGLCGGHARDRHAVRRAAHVDEPGELEEGDRVGVAAVLAADAELQARPGLAPDPGGQPHEPADA